MSWFKTIAELANGICDAQTVELAVQSEETLELLWCEGATRPTGFTTTEWMDPTVLDRDAADKLDIAPWVGSAAIRPITNAAGAVGWIIIANERPGTFSDATLHQMEHCASLIESQLDQQLMTQELDRLSEALYENERTLEETRVMLEVSNRELEQFAYIAAHELVAPLRSVAVYAEVLATMTSEWTEASRKQTGEIVGEIRDGVQRMTQQVQYLLSLSRAEQALGQLALVDTTRTAFGAVDTLTELYEDAGATVSVAPLPAVLAHDVPLQSVFANLLTNAVRYRDPSRSLHVEILAKHEPDEILIDVRDNAVGISEDAQKRIFGLFERNSTNTDGLGVGLAVSRRILAGFNASISVESSDQGSTFTMHFPRPSSHRSPLYP